MRVELAAFLRVPSDELELIEVPAADSLAAR
jgi:hypothetical protein